MIIKTLIIYQNKILYNILNEVNENFNFKIMYVEDLDFNFERFPNHIILVQKEISELKNQLIIDKMPIRLHKLFETINVRFLKQEYNFQSNINVGRYDLNLNSRSLCFDGKNLDLTEMESNVILFLKKSNKPISVKVLQKDVWGQIQDLETHTVETHIYRLRKKIKDKFNDDNFIKSLKSGYQID